jgi:hypothetical protein
MAIVFGRVIVRKAIQGACSQKATKSSIEGVTVCCTSEEEPLVRNALNEVAAFFGARWASVRPLIQTVVINEGIETSLWIPQRALLILKTDPARMKSVRNLAGWLIADYERIDVLKKHSCRLIPWSKKAVGLSSIDALLRRMDYIESLDVST